MLNNVVCFLGCIYVSSHISESTIYSTVTEASTVRNEKDHNPPIDVNIIQENAGSIKVCSQVHKISWASCSKLTTSLVNVSLNQTLISQISRYFFVEKNV